MPPVESRVLLAPDGFELDLNGRPLTFVDTPGHANHHFCVFDHASRSFFTGDSFGISYREFDSDRGPFLFAPTTPVAFDPLANPASTPAYRLAIGGTWKRQSRIGRPSDPDQREERA